MAWVKTLSHRQRDRLKTTFAIAGLPEPKPYFRKPRHAATARFFRAEGEYWDVPDSLVPRLTAIKGLAVLSRPVPADELIIPWRSS